jgi:hypothetical protein
MDVLEVVMAYYEMVDSAEPAHVVSLFATDAVYERPGYAPIQGHEELFAFYGSSRVISSGRHSVQSALVHDTSVAIQGSFTGRLKNGDAADLRFADFFDIGLDGAIKTRTTYFYAPLV